VRRRRVARFSLFALHRRRYAIGEIPARVAILKAANLDGGHQRTIDAGILARGLGQRQFILSSKGAPSAPGRGVIAEEPTNDGVAIIVNHSLRRRREIE
jgi:hypothetical protein